jgi:drug/metabolite transporter (DMT)-like permease
MGQQRTFKAVTVLILLGLIWGSGYSLAKFAITNGVTPLGYGFWQAWGPAVLLTLVCLFTHKKPIFQIKHWPYFAISGLLGIAIPNTNMYFASSHVPSGLLAVLVNTVALFVYPMALMNKQEKADGWRFLALLLSMTGIMMILGISTSGLYSKWAILALISPFGFASCSLYINKKAPKGMSALESACGMLLAASLFLFPLVISQHAFYPLWESFDVPRRLVILEIVLSSIGYLLFFKLLRLAGPVFYSLTGGVVAITGLFWGYCIFNEIPNVHQSIASVLIIGAVFLLSWRQSKHKELNKC